MQDAFSDTRELVQQVSQGNREPLDDLFSRHRKRLLRMVRWRLDWRLKGRVSHEDVVQEVYLEACRRLGDYVADPKVPFFVWLRFLTRQKLVDLQRVHLGAQARDVRREVRLHCDSPQPATTVLAQQLLQTQTSVVLRVEREELRQKLQNALDTMNEIDREVLILRHYENLTHLEIAHELGISRPTASQRYVRALRRIKQIIDGQSAASDEPPAGTEQ